MNNRNTHAYIGISKCGCIRAAVVDNPSHAKDVRKNVMDFMRYGDTIERVKNEEVRKGFCLEKHGGTGGDICPHQGACPSRQNVTV